MRKIFQPMTPKLLLASLLLLISYFSFSQTTITGEVKNENAKPLSGATLSLQNGSFRKSVQTDQKGSFVFTGLQAGQLYKLTISYVGYTTKVIDSVTAADQSPQQLSISLEPAFALGESVVVVAYSTQKKANLTGAVDQVSGQVLENRSLPNVSQGLQGMIPNLNLIMGDGKPIQSPAFNIRGNTSIGQGGNALVLIDGVEGNISLINPNDIASVTVLKDAASAAVYGARAAFGVVLYGDRKSVV